MGRTGPKRLRREEKRGTSGKGSPARPDTVASASGVVSFKRRTGAGQEEDTGVVRGQQQTRGGQEVGQHGQRTRAGQEENKGWCWVGNQEDSCKHLLLEQITFENSTTAKNENIKAAQATFAGTKLWPRC